MFTVNASVIHCWLCSSANHNSEPDRFKIWLTSVNPFLPNFAPKWPALVERRRHSMANCDWMVRGSAMITMRAYRKPPSLFRMAPSLTPSPYVTTSPSPTWGSQMHPTNDVAFRQITLALVNYLVGSHVATAVWLRICLLPCWYGCSLDVPQNDCICRCWL